ncbi:MAG: hypothetical protein M1831_000674 [Alyxoria varia]|nr:MAG: hypothetical protein M1831_000674 [Alyxoria varia]
MATLNTSQDGPAITKSYQSIVDSPLASGSAAGSSTYGQWVVYSVQAPLASAFQQDSTKDSVLKVFRIGEGELVDLIDEFSEGKVQFGFVKVKDPNTSLPKNVLIAWCGEGVPERTKGYFTSHLAAVSKLLHGYHVQVTARTDADLSPDAIIRKVSDSSGSKYSGDRGPAAAEKPPPPVASKPVFTPSKVGGSSSFTPFGSRSRQAAPQSNTDEDGWGEDAPPVTRSQIQKVESAYKPTKVNMAELTSQKPESTRAAPPEPTSNEGVVKGGYQPTGKVDIAAIRREAKEKGDAREDRPAPVKGAYEPVGKVDLADLRARSKPSEPSTISPARTGASNDSCSNVSGGLPSERLTSMPKPKVANKFGGASSFTGTKAPAPGGFENKATPAASAPIGAASRTFADEGGKTPAQIWAEKKARGRGDSGAAESPQPVASQTSGGSGWQSGYGGKKWGPVQTTQTGQSGVSSNKTGEEPQREEPASPPAGGVSAIKDRFKQSPPIQAPSSEDAPPPMDFSSKPNAGLSIREERPNMPPPPAQPAQPPRSPTPPSPDMAPSSPIQVARPVARTEEPKEMEAPEERFSPPQMPTQSMAEVIPSENKLADEPQLEHNDPARGAGEATAMSTEAAASGKQAIAQYDYEKGEDNELELRENELITHIDMVDEDWWMGQNSRGESGLFPANYVELTGDGAPLGESESASAPAAHAAPSAHAAPAAAATPTATAQYDYEAGEDNEISFPDGAKIINVEFPDDDWWLGEYGGKSGLFPANYVQLDE